MPGATWFPNLRLNYAEQVFSHATDERPAVIVRSEDEAVREVSWQGRHPAGLVQSASHHGDWIRFTDRGTCVIYGRSDTTINRFGIRMGTADIYAAVEGLDEIRDSLVVDLEYLGRPSYMPLFVVVADGIELDGVLKRRILERIREQASPRHLPDDIVAVREIPRTLTGKKMELPVRKLLLGARPETVASPDAMANPGSLAAFIDYAAGRKDSRRMGPERSDNRRPAASPPLPRSRPTHSVRLRARPRSSTSDRRWSTTLSHRWSTD